MKKYLVPTIVILIVLALSGMVYWLSYIKQPVMQATDQSRLSADDQRPVVIWSIATSHGEPLVYTYFIGSGKIEGPIAYFEGTGVVRFNQSSDLCNPTYVVSALGVNCDLDEKNILTLDIFDEQNGGREVLKSTIDPRKLGVNPSTVEGYLVPVAVAADKSSMYLGRRIETESYVAGLWKLDVATGEVTEISYIRENKIYQYDINPATKQLIGISLVPPESLGESPSAPTSVHLVDLSTGTGEILYGREAGLAFENPMVSDDGSRYAFYAADPLDPGTTVFLTGVHDTVGEHVDGVVKDWFGNTMVVDQDGNLFLYDLTTKMEIQLTNETDATVEFLGVVK